KSTKVWVIAIAVMKIRRVVIGSWEINAMDKTKTATRFMWIPGIRPVNVPARTPRIRGMIRFSI
ncbi:MAG: hypothetical protein ABIF18_04080, partial [archaeon]